MSGDLILHSHSRQRQVAYAYLIAKSTVIEAGYASEVDWQYEVSIEKLTEQVFLREAAWVILCSGMREQIVRSKFEAISSAFCDWESAQAIVDKVGMCRVLALDGFKHQAKIDAIISVAVYINRYGFRQVVENIRKEGIVYLQSFPYIGPITCFHLAKNIGFSVAKPDRHLAALAEELEYQSVQQLCADIAEIIDEPVPVVDIVLWRYLTLWHHKYIGTWLLGEKGVSQNWASSRP